MPENTSKQSTRNYEIDRTVSYSRQPAGRVKRVTVAVLVDNMRKVGADGKATQQPLTQSSRSKTSRKLVKNAVGFDEARGDSVNVVNAAFLRRESTDRSSPKWCRCGSGRGARHRAPGARCAGAGGAGAGGAAAADQEPGQSCRRRRRRSRWLARGWRTRTAGGPGAQSPLAYEQQIVQARSLVTQDPKRVAQVVKTWVGEP